MKFSWGIVAYITIVESIYSREGYMASELLSLAIKTLFQTKFTIVIIRIYVHIVNFQMKWKTFSLYIFIPTLSFSIS